MTLACLLALTANSKFFFEDLKPKSYRNGDVLDIHVGQLWSTHISVNYDFYTLDWCKREDIQDEGGKAEGLTLRDMEL